MAEEIKKAMKPETKFVMTDDGSLVYNLKQDGWEKGKPLMVNDVWITINAPKEHKIEIAKILVEALNLAYPDADKKTIDKRIRKDLEKIQQYQKKIKEMIL